jgi:dihydrofolate synthase / folylpolyglutamate synthase
VRIWRAPYPKFGAGPGLERVRAVAARLGIDCEQFCASSAVIVGSNGKGSTAAMCAALLQQARAPVGLFTSPHLLRLNERFRIDGADIDDDEFSHHWERVERAIDALGLSETCGGFEFLFLIAADWFAARGCAHTIWEAGIGGRFDPVRLIRAHRVALTSLDLEHTELLGPTLEAIACDKSDAAPEGGLIFVGPIDANVQAALEARCDARGVRVETVAPLRAFDPPLAGEHQRGNAALALKLARDLAPLSDEAVRRGFAQTHWPGRLEQIDAEPLTIVDVGHTPRAVAAALAGFEAMRGGREGVLVCGASHDKQAEALIAALARGFGIVVCAAAHHKGAPAAAIAAIAARANPEAEIVVADSVSEARAIARARARAIGGAILVAGGLFLVAEFKAAATGLDPQRLAFF